MTRASSLLGTFPDFWSWLALVAAAPVTLFAQSYLMFGNMEHLDMFMDLYSSAMLQLKVRACVFVCVCVEVVVGV